MGGHVHPRPDIAKPSMHLVANLLDPPCIRVWGSVGYLIKEIMWVCSVRQFSKLEIDYYATEYMTYNNNQRVLAKTQLNLQG